MEELINWKWIADKVWEVIKPKISEMVGEMILENSALNNGEIDRLKVLVEHHAETIDARDKRLIEINDILERHDEKIDDLEYKIEDVGDEIPDVDDVKDALVDDLFFTEEIIDGVKKWLRDAIA